MSAEEVTLKTCQAQEEPLTRGMLLNESKIQGRDPKTTFVCDVRVGAEPFCVGGMNRKLDDLKRFCCNPVEYRPLTVDPTFDFGPYNVTPISYQHLIVLRREDSNHPTMIRPVLLHEKKTIHVFALWWNSKVS